jgi:hypothetical protein
MAGSSLHSAPGYKDTKGSHLRAEGIGVAVLVPPAPSMTTAVTFFERKGEDLGIAHH